MVADVQRLYSGDQTVFLPKFLVRLKQVRLMFVRYLLFLRFENLIQLYLVLVVSLLARGKGNRMSTNSE
ncbi:hypothetical protein WS67_11310 [Burkholderia singularis]|uniref:Uncharacterized protein n=1 Tax=Burkholderia singularis TaxID=1503053 RepID=A0A118DP51_9BURK|nr:hypothetical protein WS67_11310 [Burkholderia singularis]